MVEGGSVALSLAGCLETIRGDSKSVSRRVSGRGSNGWSLRAR